MNEYNYKVMVQTAAFSFNYRCEITCEGDLYVRDYLFADTLWGMRWQIRKHKRRVAKRDRLNRELNA
jgi:hypothetical protein